MSQQPSDLSEPISAPGTSSTAPRFPWLWLVLAALAGVLLVRSLLPEGPGKKLASLSLEPLTFTGDPVALDDLKGKVVVLNFWGTWCPACRMELPHVAELASRCAGNGQCRVLAVACGAGIPDPPPSLPGLKRETKDFLSATHIDLEVYADPDVRTRRAVSEAIGFRGYPTTLVLDRQGVIRRIWTGYVPGDEEQLAHVVASLLDETGA